MRRTKYKSTRSTYNTLVRRLSCVPRRDETDSHCRVVVGIISFTTYAGRRSGKSESRDGAASRAFCPEANRLAG